MFSHCTKACAVLLDERPSHFNQDIIHSHIRIVTDYKISVQTSSHCKGLIESYEPLLATAIAYGFYFCLQ